MAGVNWNHRNGAPRRETGNGRYREGRELTVSRMGALSAFGTAPDAVSTAAGLWREKRRVGEGVAGQNNAKTRNGEYLRARGGPAVLRVALASAFALGRGFSPAAVAHGSGQRWRRAEGRLGLYRWAAAAWKEGKQGGFGTFQTGAGGFPSVPRHGRAEEGRGAPGKEGGRHG